MNLPLHPMLVHYPIACYLLELLLLLFWWFKRDEQYVRFSRFVFYTGYCLMIPTVAAGWMDAGGLNPTVRDHFTLAASLFIFSSVRALLNRPGKMDLERSANLQLAGAIVGNVLVLATAYFGGKLVYHSA